MYSVGSSVVLPPLEIIDKKQSIGIVRHVIRSRSIRKIDRISSISINENRIEKILHLSDGQSIIITNNKKINRPAHISGTLIDHGMNVLEWITHIDRENLEIRIATEGLEKISKEIYEDWKGSVTYKVEERDHENKILATGLRPPQIGGLHSIGAHWSVHDSPGTIIMPTGTGKTETMLAALAAYQPGKLLIVVPSRVLRDQTLNKFLNFGLLRSLGVLSQNVRNPIVGVIKSRPKTDEDLLFFDYCNVIVSTMSALNDDSVLPLAEKIASKIDTLFVDEAHHIPAPGWSRFREYFSKKKILQFTATPYRRDGKLVDGKILYEYPLHLAQKDGYFTNITFRPVYEIEAKTGDEAVAIQAVNQLKIDLEDNKDHLIMARCANITRATEVLEIYKIVGNEYSPVIIHSEEENSDQYLDGVNKRKHRIIVCVNMLGEGFDLPNLKIAAVHDTHKSLAILLQFTGRFTRTSGDNIGTATIIANIATQEVSSALERLYSEDADWNVLLSELSSEAANSHARLINFLNESRRLDDPSNDHKVEISQALLRPIFNTLLFEAPKFIPKSFFEGLPKSYNVQRVWEHLETKTIYFVAKVDWPIKWTRSKNIRDREWHLFVLTYDEDNSILFLSTSDKSSIHLKLAQSVGATKLLEGDNIFRCLGNITRLIFQQVGVKKHGRRNLRYAMYTGSDVVEALSIAERVGSYKSNLSGTGWENGRPITIGCSYKGRVWARDPGTIPELVSWCRHVGSKVLDETISTKDIISNVLIPEEVTALPNKQILGIDWPIEILRQTEDRVLLKGSCGTDNLSMFSIEISSVNTEGSYLNFELRHSDNTIWSSLRITIGGEKGFTVSNQLTTIVEIQIGKLAMPVEEYFSSYPPLIRFIDLSELDGNLLIKPQNVNELKFPEGSLEAWDWTGVDITKESIIKDGITRKNSIQWKVCEEYLNQGFSVVFNDDAPGEAADVIAMKEQNEAIKLVLLHCKFTSSADPGQRFKDVVEVSMQAVKSAKYKWKFKDLCQHIIEREKNLTKDGRPTRFLNGNAHNVNTFARNSRFREIKPEIIIVQPGLSKSNPSTDQLTVLASAHSYLKETIGIDMSVICSR